MFDYNAELISIVDGDTLKLSIDLGFHLRLNGTFRLARINAPELLTLSGVEAKAFVVSTLSDLKQCKVYTERSEKYGRWLCEFLFITNSEPTRWRNLSDLLLESGHAVRFKH